MNIKHVLTLNMLILLTGDSYQVFASNINKPYTEPGLSQQSTEDLKKMETSAIAQAKIDAEGKYDIQQHLNEKDANEQEISSQKNSSIKPSDEKPRGEEINSKEINSKKTNDEEKKFNELTDEFKDDTQHVTH